MRNIGIDIVENKRFNAFIDNPRKYSRILSAKEKDLFVQITNKSRKLEYLAGRFAAKEAVIKALAHTGYSFSYTAISVLNRSDGSPYVELENGTEFKILLSLSHSKDNSVAVAILVNGDE
ncbi:MAG: holo-ACP synthase [Bacilli bacterium]|nr:holo-ACP synthase [Bacilli bacterium]MDD4077019.1 holo-ACP synthase [Bacilli bacterium]